MSRPIPLPTITAFSAEDGWRKGLAAYATGKTFQFFVSPSGQARIYVWRRGKSLNGMWSGGNTRRMVRALHAAIAAGLFEGARAWA